MRAWGALTIFRASPKYFSGLSGPYTTFDGQQRRIPVPLVRDDFNWQKGNHSFTFGGTFKFIKTNSHQTTNFNYVDLGLPRCLISREASIPPCVQQTSTTAPTRWVSTITTACSPLLSAWSERFPQTTFSITNSPCNPKAQAISGPHRYFQTEAYFGDTWKVNSKLTLAYGVRYQLYSVPYEAHGDESIPTPIPISTFITDRFLAQSKAGNLM